MRLLLLTTELPDEAPAYADRAAAIAHWLARRGHAVSVVGSVAAAGGRAPRRARAAAGASGPIARGMQHVSLAVANAPALLGEAATFRPDLVGVLVPSAAAASAGLAAAHVAGVPAWLHLEEDAPPLGIEAAFACVSAAAFDAEARLARRGVAAAAAVPLPPWIDRSVLGTDAADSDVAEARSALGAGPDDVVALYAGWCGDERRARIIVEASCQVPPRGAIRFVTACEGAGARLLAAAAGSLPRLVAVPLPQPDARAALFAAADLHLMPEGAAASDLLIPAKLPTLLASGRPVLAGPPCGPFALPLDPSSGERLAEGVIALAADAAERRARGVAARRAADDYFNKERVLRDLERRLVALARS